MTARLFRCIISAAKNLRLSGRFRRRWVRLPLRVFEALEQQPRSDARSGDKREVSKSPAIPGRRHRCDHGVVLIRIEGRDLPGRSCGPGPDSPDRHRNVHVAVQGREGQQDLVGMVRGDARSARWELERKPVPSANGVDLRGAQIHGGPGLRFIYLSWGAVDAKDSFTMFRRAKLWLDAVPEETITAALDEGLLVGRLGLTDDKAWPLCASVRPPRIQWSAAAPERSKLD